MRVRLRYLVCKLHLRLQPGTQKKTTAFEILRAIKVRGITQSARKGRA